VREAIDRGKETVSADFTLGYLDSWLDAEIQKAMVQAQSREPLQAVSAGTQ